MHSKTLPLVSAGIFTLLSLPLSAQITVGVFDPGKPTMTKVENQDLMGSNLRFFDLKQEETCQTCIDACLNDPNCVAYTFTKPGFQAPFGRCYLKSSVPAATANNNCISGVKSTVSGNSQLTLPGILSFKPTDAPSFFANASVELLAKQLSTGQTLGNQSTDSKDFNFHHNWAKIVDENMLKEALADKFSAMVDLKAKEGVEAMANWYALVCSTWANYGVDFGSAGNSKDPAVHKNWAMGQPASVLKNQIKLRVDKIFASYGVQTDQGTAPDDTQKVAARCEKMLTIPGLVIGMSNFAKDGSKFIPPGYIAGYKTYRLLDYESSNLLQHEVFEVLFYKLSSRDDDDPYTWSLPPSIVLGLVYSAINPEYIGKVFGYYANRGPDFIGGNRFKKENGGDLGAPEHQGWYWYESTGLGFSDWQMILCLPRGTVVGLKHSINQRGKQFVWQGITYDAANPAISPPQGFLRMHYGDMGAPEHQGYYWYEKITDPPKN
jgi:hypothetical protein